MFKYTKSLLGAFASFGNSSGWASPLSSSALLLSFKDLSLLILLMVILRLFLHNALLSAVIVSLSNRGSTSPFFFPAVVDPFVDLRMAHAKSIGHACYLVCAPVTISGILML